MVPGATARPGQYLQLLVSFPLAALRPNAAARCVVGGQQRVWTHHFPQAAYHLPRLVLSVLVRR